MKSGTTALTAHASMLDRLLDSAPDNLHDPRLLQHDLLDYRRAIARDLEALLNTRKLAHEELFSAYPEAQESVLQFGLEDMSGLSLLNPADQELIRTRLRQTIERHEPRLSRIRVQIDIPDRQQKQVQFRVEGVLKIHPQRPQVSFDATLNLSSSTCRIMR